MDGANIFGQHQSLGSGHPHLGLPDFEMSIV